MKNKKDLKKSKREDREFEIVKARLKAAFAETQKSYEPTMKNDIRTIARQLHKRKSKY